MRPVLFLHLDIEASSIRSRNIQVINFENIPIHADGLVNCVLTVRTHVNVFNLTANQRFEMWCNILQPNNFVSLVTPANKNGRKPMWNTQWKYTGKCRLNNFFDCQTVWPNHIPYQLWHLPMTRLVCVFTSKSQGFKTRIFVRLAENIHAVDKNYSVIRSDCRHILAFQRTTLPEIYGHWTIRQREEIRVEPSWVAIFSFPWSVFAEHPWIVDSQLRGCCKFHNATWIARFSVLSNSASEFGGASVKSKLLGAEESTLMSSKNDFW